MQVVLLSYLPRDVQHQLCPVAQGNAVCVGNGVVVFLSGDDTSFLKTLVAALQDIFKLLFEILIPLVFVQSKFKASLNLSRERLPIVVGVDSTFPLSAPLVNSQKIAGIYETEGSKRSLHIATGFILSFMGAL